MKTDVLRGSGEGQVAFAFAAHPDLSQLHIAEEHLLWLADYVYGRTPLKPMSKTLFFISRCLLATTDGEQPTTAQELVERYEDRRRGLQIHLDDDFSFGAVVQECSAHLATILTKISEVRSAGRGADVLGLAFNTLLRGKWEGGEGLGTYLTPEEIVVAMVRMSLHLADSDLIRKLGPGLNSLLFGDVCGGTGRFVHRIAAELQARGVSREQIAGAARLYDQSSLAVDFARMNFVLEELYPQFDRVDDSLTTVKVSGEQGRFLFLATNPPFGAGKYSWSEALGRAMAPGLLSAVGMRDQGDSVDPAALFLVRNLSLLAEGGVLAIVLPDGLLHSSTVRSALAAFERTSGARVEVAAIVSLPTAAFSLGGTVAKTSFIVIQREPSRVSGGMYLAEPKHIGFLKRGNRRVPDPGGNDLERIVAEFCEGKGNRLKSWRDYDRLSPVTLVCDVSAREGERLGELVEPVRTRARPESGLKERSFHVSVLDVDETGFIDLLAATKNKPATEGLECKPGDILLSCINPRIWRVTVVPELAGRWSCSAEFLVLRPRAKTSSWRIALRLHQPTVAAAVRAMAGGTSSSRQRVPKDDVLDVIVPELSVDESAVKDHARRRQECYRIRLEELALYSGVQGGS